MLNFTCTTCSKQGYACLCNGSPGNASGEKKASDWYWYQQILQIAVSDVSHWSHSRLNNLFLYFLQSVQCMAAVEKSCQKVILPTKISTTCDMQFTQTITTNCLKLHTYLFQTARRQRKVQRLNAGRSYSTSLSPSSCLLPVPGSTVSNPHSNLSPSTLTGLVFQLWPISWQPFIKNRFQKSPIPINQTAEMSLFTAPHFQRPVSITSSNFKFICTAWVQRPGPDDAVNKTLYTSSNTYSFYTHTHVHISSTYLPPHLFCSRCHCHCRWAGSKCRNLGLECCCYSRDCTAEAWKKDYIRLQQSGGQSSDKEGKKNPTKLPSD